MVDNNKKPVSTSASTSAENVVGGLLQGINATQNILSNQYSGAYSFWHQDDVKDPNTGKKYSPKGSLGWVLQTAIDKGYLQASDPTNFDNLFKSSDWYKANGGQGLLAAEAQFTNPANYQAAFEIRKQAIQAEATKLGYTLPDDKNLNDLVTGSMYQAFDASVYGSSDYQTKLQSKITQTAVNSKIPITSGAGITTEQSLRSTAQDMGVYVGDDYITSAANAVNDPSSNATLETYQQHLRDMAKSQYSGFAGLIDKGMTMKQIADPYVQQMASTLEINPNLIDFSKDGMIQKALGAQIGPDGVSQPVPMWQFQQNLRQDPRWQYTNNARDTVTGIAHGILKDFGVAT